MSVIKGLAIATLTSLAAATVLLLLQVTPSVSQEEYNPDAPQARATERALRRAERRSMRLSPEARETARAARREEERQRWQEARPVEVRDPLPLPVELRNPSALLAAGRPVGATCQGNQSCTLRLAPAIREVVIVTSVWSATKIECDDLVTASPGNGMPIAPWWRCEHQLRIEGSGAGYSGFVMIK